MDARTPSMQLAELRVGRPITEYLADAYGDRALSLRDVGAELGVDAATVQRWLKRCGITIRPAGRRRAA